MDSQIYNYALFFIVLIIIIYLGCVDRNLLQKLFENRERFNNKSSNNQLNNNIKSNNIKSNNKLGNNIEYDKLEGTHYQIKNPLIPIVKKNVNWRTLYESKYQKMDNVKKDDNFDGTVIRNYLDNTKYFLN